MTQLPEDVEEWRDERWRRSAMRRVDSVADAERFIEDVGFAACLTDARRPGPSLYIAVCGRRDEALREVARCFLAGAGMTRRGELARVTGLSRADAGRGNRALVAEGSAVMVGTGVYRMET